MDVTKSHVLDKINQAIKCTLLYKDVHTAAHAFEIISDGYCLCKIRSLTSNHCLVHKMIEGKYDASSWWFNVLLISTAYKLSLSTDFGSAYNTTGEPVYAIQIQNI